MTSRIRKTKRKHGASNTQAHRRAKGLRVTVAVSLPAALVAEIDRVRTSIKISRSRYVELALTERLKGEKT